MSDFLVKHWVGQRVNVTLRSSPPAAVSGVIAHADAEFLVLEQTDHTRLLIPFTSVLHVEEETGKP